MDGWIICVFLLWLALRFNWLMSNNNFHKTALNCSLTPSSLQIFNPLFNLIVKIFNQDIPNLWLGYFTLMLPEWPLQKSWVIYTLYTYKISMDWMNGYCNILWGWNLFEMKNCYWRYRNKEPNDSWEASLLQAVFFQMWLQLFDETACGL